MKLHPLLMTIFCLVPLGQADAQPKSADDKGKDPAQLAIYAARNTAVNDLASMLAEVLDDSIRVATDPSNNLLLIRIGSGAPERVLALLKQLDRQPRTVLVDAHLLKLDGAPLTDDESATLSGSSKEVASSIDKLKSSDRAVVAKHMKIAALENQTTTFQVGEDRVVRTGFTTGGRTSYRLENVSIGTILKVTARTTPEDVILLNVDFESSGVEPSGDDDDEEAPTASRPGVSTLTHQSTVQLGAGQSRLVGVLAGGQPSQTKHAYLVISARIADEPSSQRTVSARTFSRSPNAGRGAPRRTQVTDEAEESATDARYRKYFRAMIARYDTDKDGQLSAEEWQAMSGNPEAADANMNGFITLEELVDWHRKKK